ncbi:MAG: ATP-binding protein [Pseudomonadales bacterium]
MTNNRLFLQMFSTAGFAAVMAALVIYINVQFQFEKALFDKAKASLEAQMLFASAVARNRLLEGEFGEDSAWLENIHSSDTRFTLILPDGTVAYDSSHIAIDLDNHRNRPEILQAARSGKGQAQRYSQSVGSNLLYIAERLDTDQGTLGYVRLSSAVSLIADDLRDLQNQLLLVILLTLAVVFFTSYLLSRRFYRPIAEATNYAREIADGNYQLRLPGRRRDELGVLERSLNELARKTEDRMDSIVESRNQLEAILSGLDEGVVALDRDEQIAHINRAALGLLSLDDTVVGSKVWEAIRITKIQSMLEAALNDDSTEPDQSLVVNDRTLELDILTLTSDSGEHEGTILVFQDVTERDRLDRIRSDFVANASHELKTPLAAIKGIMETVIDDEAMPADVAKRFFHRVLSQTNRLNKIVLDLMQLSRFDSYRNQQVHRDRVELVREIRQVYSAFKVTAEEQKVSLELELEEEKLHVLGDSEALSQLLSNLVENAIKYSPEDSTVEIRLRREKNLAVIQVEDNGIGISAPEQARIFERFYRVDPARSREMGGTGLGLSIVKHIADLHDGSVEVSSEPGKGSTFTVRLPVLG